MLVIHHLGHSQSDRLLWLCEELGVPYEMKKYDRSPILSPPELVALHPIGAAPVITDGDLMLAESAACMEYIIHTYGGGRLVVAPSAPNYTDYLFWFHFANGSVMPALARALTLQTANIPSEHPLAPRLHKKIKSILAMIDERLSKSEWLAGNDFTAADIMNMFALTGFREFYQYDTSDFPNILRYLEHVTSRDAYRRAMAKGDPDIEIETMIKGPPPPIFKALRQ